MAGSGAVPTPAVSETTAVDMSLLTALANPNPSASKGGAEIIVNENSLVSSGPVGRDEISDYEGAGQIRLYTVRDGDSLSEIADMFAIKTNTILWANDLKKATDIRPGDTLIILPITGVRHIVKSGDTIASIAKKYDGDADEIVSYNQLDSAKGLTLGDTVIIPNGAMQVELPISKAKSSKSTGGSSANTSGYFSYPAPGAIKTQGIHGYNAVDLASAVGTPIKAAAAGTVIVSKGSGWNGGYGQYLVIKHNNGTQTLYAHLSRNDVGVGDYVNQGEVIGAMGNTGKSTGPHLHFEVRGGSNPF